jgi:hypothetical protein
MFDHILFLRHAAHNFLLLADIFPGCEGGIAVSKWGIHLAFDPDDDTLRDHWRSAMYVYLSPPKMQNDELT